MTKPNPNQDGVMSGEFLRSLPPADAFSVSHYRHPGTARGPRAGQAQNYLPYSARTPTKPPQGARCSDRNTAWRSQVKSSQVGSRSARYFSPTCSPRARMSALMTCHLITDPFAISAHSRPPLLASGAHSIGFRMVVCCLCIDLT